MNLLQFYRACGSQVKFFMTYSALTKNGYGLMGIDTGKEDRMPLDWFTGKVITYFYLQKI